jgi:hypothetical protein
MDDSLGVGMPLTRGIHKLRRHLLHPRRSDTPLHPMIPLYPSPFLSLTDSSFIPQFDFQFGCGCYCSLIRAPRASVMSSCQIVAAGFYIFLEMKQRSDKSLILILFTA